jgi:hypothetical protein
MPPTGTPGGLVAVVVRGNSMRGQLEDGWTVYYRDRRDPPTEDIHKKLCVVGLVDGRILIKYLYPGRKPHHFDLHSTSEPPLLDQHVQWAAPIEWIMPK